MRCTFCLTFDNTKLANCAVCGAPLPSDATSHVAPTSSTRSSTTPQKSITDATTLSHVVTIQTAREVLSTAFLCNTRRGETKIAALLDDGSAHSWRVQNNDVSQIETRELLAPLRHAPTLAVCNHEIAWTTRDEILTARPFSTSATSNDPTSSTRCCEFRFSSPICRVAASSENAHIAVATTDGQVHLLGFSNDAISSLWSVDTLRGVTALAISGDAEKIAVGDDNGHLALWNRKNARDCWTTDTQSLWVAGAAFSPNSHALAMVDCNGVLQIRAAQNSANLQKIVLDFAPNALCLLNDNRHLIAIDAHRFSLIDSWTGQTVSHVLKSQNEETASESAHLCGAFVCGASEENLFAVAASREIQLWRFECL